MHAGMTTTQRPTPQQAYELDRKHVFHSWSAQAKITPLVIARSEGSRVWDGDGTEYLDFTGQLVFTNVGHQHPKVIAAIKEQADTLCTVAPQFANDRRSQLAAMIAQLLPDSLNTTFFTNGGTEAIEHAVRLARFVTGRRKILTSYRSYHGATGQSILMTGDQRRLANDKGASEVVHFFAPFLYRSEFWAETVEQETERALTHLEHTITAEGPDAFAALVIEPVVGSAGVVPLPSGYLEGVRALCDTYGIKLIVDEVMVGFGRTGKWFSFQHFDVVPDMITFAKGVNSGYVPLGGVVMSDEIKQFFDETPYPGGLTYSGHPLACAAGVATLEAYREEQMIDNAARLGTDVLGPGLEKLAANHAAVGNVRGVGAFWALELVSDQQAKTPDAAAAAAVAGVAKKAGLLVIASANRLHLAPPLNISDEDAHTALSILDEALATLD